MQDHRWTDALVLRTASLFVCLLLAASQFQCLSFNVLKPLEASEDHFVADTAAPTLLGKSPDTFFKTHIYYANDLNLIFSLVAVQTITGFAPSLKVLLSSGSPRAPPTVS